MGIVKKHSPRIYQRLGASNLHSDIPDIINQPSLACSLPRSCKDVPVPSVKRKGSIKSFIRRSLPSGGQSSRTRLPSPHSSVAAQVQPPHIGVKLNDRP